jgi:hypothetical protein
MSKDPSAATRQRAATRGIDRRTSTVAQALPRNVPSEHPLPGIALLARPTPRQCGRHPQPEPPSDFTHGSLAVTRRRRLLGHPGSPSRRQAGHAVPEIPHTRRANALGGCRRLPHLRRTTVGGSVPALLEVKRPGASVAAILAGATLERQLEILSVKFETTLSRDARCTPRIGRRGSRHEFVTSPAPCLVTVADRGRGGFGERRCLADTGDRADGPRATSPAPASRRPRRTHRYRL